MKKIIAFYAVAMLLLISCKTSNKAMDLNNTSTNLVTDTQWELTKYGGKTIDQSEIIGTKIHFSLNSINNSISGYSGCNIFNETYTLVKGNRIKISRLASTRMACRDAKIDENELLKMFEMADNFTLNEGVLSLNVGGKTRLAEFKKANSENL